MPVLGHPPQLEGALRSAYGICATPHRGDSMRDSDSVAFFPPSPKRSIPVSLSVGKPKEGINPTARSESPTLG